MIYGAGFANNELVTVSVVFPDNTVFAAGDVRARAGRGVANQDFGSFAFEVDTFGGLKENGHYTVIAQGDLDNSASTSIAVAAGGK